MPSASLQEILCCLGQPVAGNPLQYVMEKVFASAGLDWRYLTLEVAPDSLGDAVRGMKAMGFLGGNVAMPHQVAIVQHLDGLSGSAALIGAASCLHRRDSQLIGENIDGQGFVEALRSLVDPAGQRVVLLGAGGVARAIAVELARAGAAHITVVSRRPDPGQNLATLVAEQLDVPAQAATWQGDFSTPGDATLLINATSIGLNDASARVPVAASSLHAELVVADVVFNPPQTRLLREATARGCRTLDGLGMLANSAAASFRLWTSGREPDLALVRESVEEFLSM